MAEDIKVHPLDIRGQMVDVYITEGGTWKANLEDVTYSDRSKDELREKLMAASRKKAVKVEVPFSKLDNRGNSAQPNYEIRHGVATGIHQGTGKVLVRLSRYGRLVSEQWDGNEDNSLPIMRPISEEEGAKLIALKQAQDEAYKAYQEYRRSLAIHLRGLVVQAIDEAQRKLSKDEAKTSPVTSPYMDTGTDT